jgi:uncharacterized protein YndB with AHSA1/START domain
MLSSLGSLSSFLILMLFVSSCITDSNLKNENVIYKKIYLKAKKEKVWSALTDERELAKWWNKGVKLQPYRNGQFYEPWGEGQLATGSVINLKLQEFITFTWKEKYWSPSESSVCTFSIEEHKEGTMLKIHHSGWESISDLNKRKKLIEGFNQGWDVLLPKLVKYIQEQ